MRTIQYVYFLLFILVRISALNFRIVNDLIEVESRSSGYLPLCALNFKERYGEAACATLGRNYTTSSTVFLGRPRNASISTTFSVAQTNSVACTSAQCFTYPTGYCNTAIRVLCETPHELSKESKKSFVPEPGCTGTDILIGKKCVEVKTIKAKGYTEAEFDIPGEGRCLAVNGTGWTAVDCETTGAVLCEYSRECIDDGEYKGKKNVSMTGLPCMRWNDPSILFYGEVVPEQATVKHNFCRDVTETGISCFTTPNQLVLCDLPNCSDGTNRVEIHADQVQRSACGSDSFQCGGGPTETRCVPNEFRCDYEKDCADGSDEQDCKDYLQVFELFGALKLVAKVTEIWTYIPHVQGCAKRCTESSLVCEAFSYEPRNQICLLTDSVEMGSNLVHKGSAQYYRKKFASGEIRYELRDNILHIERNGTWSTVCDEELTLKDSTAICQIFGYSRGVARWRLVAASPVGRSLTCLREASCSTDPSTATSCYPLRCSRCAEGVCGDGSCLRKEQLCNTVKDCEDGSDEQNCNDLSFRLVNGSETTGNVEVQFGGAWFPACAAGIGYDSAVTICEAMNMATTPVAVLSSTPLPPGHSAWRVECMHECSLKGLQMCERQARIRCGSPAKFSQSSQCGVRHVDSTPARDPQKVRLARVVGGFETLPGAFPWTAAVRIKETKAHHCGASLLNERHFITAAHCFEEDQRPSTYEVVVGDWDNNRTEGTEQVYDVTAFYFYPLYKDLFSHDLAIIEIARPGVELNNYVVPICLPTREFQYDAGKKCTVSGWGSMGLAYPTKLQAAVLPIIDRSACLNSSKIYASMSRSAFCAGYLEGGIDSCQGDSGGPMACQDEHGVYSLAGVISWGDGCAQRNQPGIYTMVAPYLTWIENVISKRT